MSFSLNLNYIYSKYKYLHVFIFEMVDLYHWCKYVTLRRKKKWHDVDNEEQSDDVYCDVPFSYEKHLGRSVAVKGKACSDVLAVKWLTCVFEYGMLKYQNFVGGLQSEVHESSCLFSYLYSTKGSYSGS